MTVHPSLAGLKAQPLPHLPIPHPIQLICTTTKVYHPPPLPPPHYGYYGCYAPYMTPGHHHGGSGSSCSHQTSSDDDPEDPTMFPHISTWLMELDTSPRGADGQIFAQYAEMITGQGYFRLCDLADSMTIEELKTVCPGILGGVAKALLRYVSTDVKWIRDKALKACKQAKRDWA